MRRFSQIWLSTIYESTKVLILVLFFWAEPYLKRFSCFLRSNFSSLILKNIKKKEKEEKKALYQHFI